MKRIFVVGAICLALSACSGTPDAVVSPSAPVTSAGTPTPSASDPARDPLYLEAVEVYEKYLAEILKLERAGGAKELPASLEAMIAGSFTVTLAELYSELLANGTRMAPAPDPQLTTAPNPGVSLEDSDVSIQTCVDARDVPQLNTKGTRVGSGSLVFQTVYFKRSGEELKVLGTVGEVVSACPFS